jgi:polyphosphate kinase 2 (PPK2 family)
LVLAENLPGITSTKNIDTAFWNERYRIIRQFEHITSQNGTVILKFFLHLSKDEQRRRLISRIDETDKNWKFSIPDVQEREHWDAYQIAYDRAITATSTTYAPWFVIPADNKWYARLAIAGVIYRHMHKLGLQYPVVTPQQRKELLKVRKRLINEEGAA